MLLATWRFCDEQREPYEPNEQGEQQKCISKCITWWGDALAPVEQWVRDTGSPPWNSPPDRQPPEFASRSSTTPDEDPHTVVTGLTFNRVPYREFESFP